MEKTLPCVTQWYNIKLPFIKQYKFPIDPLLFYYITEVYFNLLLMSKKYCEITLTWI